MVLQPGFAGLGVSADTANSLHAGGRGALLLCPGPGAQPGSAVWMLALLELLSEDPRPPRGPPRRKRHHMRLSIGIAFL